MRQWIGLRPQTPTSRNNDKTDEAMEAKKRQWRRASSMRLRDYMEEDDVEQIAKRVEAIRRQRDEQKTLMDELIEIDALDGTTEAVMQATEKQQTSIAPKAPRGPQLGAPQIVAQVVEDPASRDGGRGDAGRGDDAGAVSPPTQRSTDFNVKGQPEVGMTSQNVSAVLSPVAEEE